MKVIVHDSTTGYIWATIEVSDWGHIYILDDLGERPDLENTSNFQLIYMQMGN